MALANYHRLQEFDWTQTPLGDRASWPPEMNAAICMMMASDFPMCTGWGREHIQIYNDAYNTIYGAKHPASFGSPARESWPEIWEFLCPALDQVLTEGKTLWFVETLLPLVRLSQPEECYFDFSYSPIKDMEGENVGVLSVVTERTSEVILRRRQKLSDLDAARDAENTFDAVIMALRNLLEENEMDCARAALYSVASDTGAPDGEIWTVRSNRDFVQKMRPLAARALRRGSMISDCSVSAAKNSGQDGATCIPFYSLEGVPCCALVIEQSDLVAVESNFPPYSVSISTRVHAVLHAAELRERELGQMREQIAEQGLLYRFLFDNMQDGVAYCATSGAPGDDEVIMAANTRLCAMLGYDADELVGMSRDAVFAADDMALKAALEIRDRNGKFSGELVLRAKDGRRVPVDLSSNLIEFGEGQSRSFSIVRDNTQRKQVEDERAERVRLETVANLAGSLAHDTNNLMTIVIGSTEFLDDRLPPDSVERQMARNAMVAAERASGLTNQLLVFSRQQPLAARPVDLNAFLEEIRPLIASALGGMNTLTLRYEAKLPPCLADPAQLTTALLNLVANARHAMPQAGELAVETFRLEGPSTGMGVGAKAPVQLVGLRVRDSGTGIPVEIQDRIFEPFFTTKEVGSGSGLGLSIVKRFMDELGGTLRMTSAPDQGTMFELCFRTATQAVPKNETDEIEARVRGETILYVEDNETVRAQTQIMLRQIGANSVAFGTGREALEWIRSGGRADLLLTDLVLPGGMSGLDVATAVRRVHAQLPVVITTGYDPRAALAQEENRHFPVLGKPYSRRSLAAMLLRAMGQS